MTARSPRRNYEALLSHFIPTQGVVEATCEISTSRALEDEFAIELPAHGKIVFADFLEAVAFVESLRAEILGPHTHVQRLAATARQPVEHHIHDARADLQALRRGEHVQAFDLTRTGLEILHREPARPGDAIPERRAALVARDPDRDVRSREQRAVLRLGVRLCQERGEVLARIEMAESLGERGGAELRQQWRVGSGGAANQA